MAEKRTLTDAYIKNLEAPEKRFEIPDKIALGMVLRVTPTGNKSFAFRYWYSGTSRQRTIGRYGEYSLAEARAIVNDWRKLLDDGLDPMAEKNKQKEHSPITLKEYVEIFKNDYVQRRLKASTQKTYSSRLNKVTESKLSRMPLEDISRSQVRSFLKSESKAHPTNANRLHSILSKLFNEAIEDGYMTKNPLIGMEKLTQERPRDVSYSNKQIKAIWEAIETEWKPLRSLLKILLITGQRVGETSQMKWSDLQDNVWRIPSTDTKNKSAHVVPLSNLALREIEAVRAISGAGTFVFASLQKPDHHIKDFAHVTERIRKKAELPEFRLHDIRHIVATKMIELGIEFIHVGKVLNHKGLSASNSITSRYINSDMHVQKVNAMNTWESKLIRITSGLEVISNNRAGS